MDSNRRAVGRGDPGGSAAAIARNVSLAPKWARLEGADLRLAARINATQVAGLRNVSVAPEVQYLWTRGERRARGEKEERGCDHSFHFSVSTLIGTQKAACRRPKMEFAGPVIMTRFLMRAFISSEQS